jgi:hypothetical protein
MVYYAFNQINNKKKEYIMNYTPPKRTFEYTGFVHPKQSYYVPLGPVVNWNNQDMKTMVDSGRYFSIVAPRQSGKTTFFNAFSKSLESNPNYIFILMSFENCKDYDVKTFYSDFQKDFYQQLIQRLKDINCSEIDAVQNFLDTHQLTNSSSFYYLFVELNQIISQKKIVIFIDEFDGIPLNEINNFLATIRKVYQKYKDKTEKALYSIGLIGIRNITQITIGGVSPFNIADHVALPPFTLNNIRDLYAQYTHETHQPFSDEAIQKVFEETQGQPWLVNRLGSILTLQVKPKTTDEIKLSDIEKAIQIVINEKNVHFDYLFEKAILYQKTVESILSREVKYLPYDNAQSWLIQYGVIRKSYQHAVIANPIYQKILSSLLSTKMFNSQKFKKKIFISYCHDDRQWLDRLTFYLNQIKHQNIDIWFDDSIQTGTNWSVAIADAIQTSHMTICLISPHFLNSEFIRETEIPAIQARQDEGMIVFPILVESCLWYLIDWLKKMQVYPKDNNFLSEFDEKEQKKQFIEMVTEISQLLSSE